MSRPAKDWLVPLSAPSPVVVLESRVANGAVALDTRRPGWRKRLKRRRLNIADSTRCVLGLLHAWDDFTMDEYGPFGFITARPRDYAVLTELWKAEIAKPDVSL